MSVYVYELDPAEALDFHVVTCTRCERIWRFTSALSAHTAATAHAAVCF